MEKLAIRLAEYISKAMNYNQDKQDIIAYGLIGLFQMTVIAVAVSIIGLLADFWYEAIIIFLGTGLLRKSTGGAHAQTMLGCTVLSITLISFLSALCRYVLMGNIRYYIAIPADILLILLCFFITYYKAPVDSANKPIKRPEKIKRLRKQSFITIGIYGAVCMILVLLSRNYPRFMSIADAILCSLLWQTFTLTKCGAFVVNILELPIRKNL